MVDTTALADGAPPPGIGRTASRMVLGSVTSPSSRSFHGVAFTLPWWPIFRKSMGSLSLFLRSCHITFHDALCLPSLNFEFHSASPTKSSRLFFHSMRRTTLVLLVTSPDSSANARALDIIRDRNR